MNMIIIKLLLNVSLLFNVALAVTWQYTNSSTKSNLANLNKDEYRLPFVIIPLSYNIIIEPHIEFETNRHGFRGKFYAIFLIMNPIRNISLHAHELKIDENETKLIHVDNGTIHKPQEHIYRTKVQLLNLNFNYDIKPGVYALYMIYTGVLASNVTHLLKNEFLNAIQRWSLATKFRPTGARHVFPCWDEPALKAIFNISIRHSRNYVAFSNMPIREQKIDNNNIVWTYFETTPLISTHVVQISIGDFYHTSNLSIANMWCQPIKVQAPEYIGDIYNKIEQFMTFYVTDSTKAPKMHQIVFANNKFDTVDGQTTMTQFLSENEKLNFNCDKEDLSKLVAYEISRKWFGNMITPFWWRHAWLSEGLASFFEYYILDKIYVNARVMDLFVVHYQQVFFKHEYSSDVKPVTYEVTTPEEIQTLFSTVIYKATFIVRMLQHIITEEVFRKGINKYIVRHKFKSVTPNDFWSAMQHALDESDLHYKNINLKERMETWLTQNKYPILYITRDNITGYAIINDRFYFDEYYNLNILNNLNIKNNNTFWIPVTYTTESNPNFTNTVPTVWLKSDDYNVKLTHIYENEWIIVNLQQIGYYRVDYDSSIWRNIAKYLNCEEYTKIHVLNRAQVIDDIYDLLIREQTRATVDIFLEITKYLRRETDYIPWYPMFRIISELSDVLQSPHMSIMKLHILHLLEGLLEKIGYEENYNDDEAIINLRLLAVKWACEIGNSQCRKIAHDKLKNHFSAPFYKILPHWEDWTYCMGMKKAGQRMWDILMDKYMESNKRNKTLLKYLLCVERPKLIITYLKMIASKSFSDTERIQIYNAIIKKHSYKTEVYEYITNIENFKKTLPSGMSSSDALSKLIRYIYPRLDMNTTISDNKLLNLSRNFKFDEKDKSLLDVAFQDGLRERSARYFIHHLFDNDKMNKYVKKEIC